LHLLEDLLRRSTMSQVIYARVPDSLKEAADTYAGDRGVTLTAAVVDLLERGLAATTDERSIGQLELNLARVSAEKAQVEAELQATKTELAAVETVFQRASQPLGTCPKKGCGSDFTGYDLLAVGRCGTCGQPLGDLITPGPKGSSLNQQDYMVLLAIVGAMLGVAYFASKGK
jgi:hypothetical protein